MFLGRVRAPATRGRTWPAALLVILVGVASAGEPALLVPPPGVVAECHDDVQVFTSLKSGTVDYCRGHLRYVPGALDCYRLVDRVCSVFLPATAEWTDTYYPRARIPFPCPEGPTPPVCRRLDVQ